MDTKRIVALLSLGIIVCSGPAFSQDFRPNRPPLPAVALDRPMRGEEAINKLAAKMPGVANHYGMTSEKLAERFRKDKDLWVDRQGRLFFADSHTPAPVEAPVVQGSPTVQEALVPLEQTFLLHSRPGATKKIYLDFNGHTTSGTSWKDIKDGDTTFVTPPYDFDGNPANFSTLELERIQYIWQRVAEDYAPFDVDVTTEDPGLEGLRKTSATDVNYGIRVSIGGASTDWYATAGYGGVAYIGSFDWSTDTPCFVFPNNLGTGNEKYVAEAISHEVGHTLDLYHDGTSTVGYYQGQGSGTNGWAPIMGVGYYKPVVQWSKGEYTDANNTEDDLAKITAGYNIAYIADDYGNDFATAASLPSGQISVDGIIERSSDVDMFQFNAGAGTFTINIGVDSRSPNLNVRATLYNSSGTVVAVSDPPDFLGASFNLSSMPAGNYYLAVEGIGYGDPVTTGYSDYGSIGIYAISGTIPQSDYPVAQVSATPISGYAPLTVQLSAAGSHDPDGGIVTYLWDLGDSTTSVMPDPATMYTVPGTYTAVLTVTDDEGLSSTASVRITVQDSTPAAPAQLSARAVSKTQINLKWTDMATNEAGFYVERSTNGGAWTRIAALGANSTGYSSNGLTANTSYSYRVQSFNGSTVSVYSNTASTKTKR
jgi:PKD repeat protein